MIMEAIDKAGYKAGEDVFLGFDCAASLNSTRMAATSFPAKTSSSIREGFSDFLASLCDQYPIASIEDGLDESDWDGWAYLTKILGDRIQLVGDDLFVTNPAILKKGIDEGVANSILIKVNQIGTLSETLEAIKLAQARLVP